MAQHFVTVCVFCLLCATHTPCSAHTDLSEDRTLIDQYNNGLMDPNRLNLPKLPLHVPVDRSVSKNVANIYDLNKLHIDKNNLIFYKNLDEKQIAEHKNLLQTLGNHGYTEVYKSKKTIPDLSIVYDDNDNKINFKAEEENKFPTKISESHNNFNEEIKNNMYSVLHRYKRVKKSTINTLSEDNTKNIKLRRPKRHSAFNFFDDQYYVQKLFNFFGNGKNITIEGFEKLIRRLGLHRMVENTTNSNSNCTNSRQLITSFIRNTHASNSIHSSEDSTVNSDENVIITPSVFKRVCPLLIYQLSAESSAEREGCVIPSLNETEQAMLHAKDPDTKGHRKEENVIAVWLYASLSIIIISACGLLGVAVIPFMQKHFYHQLLQFLVALAVGTLCGDALLHLLPHAMMSHGSHTDSKTSHEHLHDDNMWKGFVAMIGVIFFFFTEKFLTLGAEFRKRRQKKQKLPTRVRVMRDNDSVGNNSVGEKLCKHKYSSYPYCYDEIATETQDDHHNRNFHQKQTASIDSSHNNTNITMINDLESDSDVTSVRKSCSDHLHKHEANQNDLSAASKNINVTDTLLNQSDDQKKIKIVRNDNSILEDLSLPRNDLQLSEEESYTVILREHENKHHGHSHTHGHVHSAPKTLSSVAWMVIMGDGLHNFTDGMAIGAAFASGIAGGFSTSVAVFCHELPHELGDFAVLLKAGMSAKQAVFYNMLSSVLCFLGCVFGVILGHNEAASSWIFAIAAGMFIYIALVDMIPELTSSHSNEGGSLLQCLFQFFGLMAGLGIMTLIAKYEYYLKKIFDDD